MRHWLALGVTVVGVTWGPFLYSEWAREPVNAKPESQLSAATTPESTTAVPSAAEPAAPEPAQAPQFAEAQAQAPAPAAAPVPSPAPDPAGETPTQPAANGGEARTRVFHRVFDREPRDAFWASATEPRLVGLLHGAGVAEAAIGDVACRRTVCRVAFRSADLEDELEEHLSERMHEEFGELALDTHDAESEQHATLYVLRTGYVLDPPRGLTH